MNTKILLVPYALLELLKAAANYLKPWKQSFNFYLCPYSSYTVHAFFLPESPQIYSLIILLF